MAFQERFRICLAYTMANLGKICLKTPEVTVAFWGSEIWLEIFAQNPGFTIVKQEKKIKSEGKLW